MLGLALGIGAGLANIAGGIFGKSEHDKYADLVESMTETMPDEMNMAKETYAEQATKGLTGYDTIKENIEGQTLTSLNEAKKYADSPASILGLIGDLQSNQSDKMRALGVQDAEVKQANQLGYANFLSQVYAPTKMNIDRRNAELLMGAQQERMAGTSELIGGITGGINAGAGLYGQAQQLAQTKDMNAALKSFWGVDAPASPEVFGGETPSPMESLGVSLGDYGLSVKDMKKRNAEISLSPYMFPDEQKTYDWMSSLPSFK